MAESGRLLRAIGFESRDLLNATHFSFINPGEKPSSSSINLSQLRHRVLERIFFNKALARLLTILIRLRKVRVFDRSKRELNIFRYFVLSGRMF